VTRTAGTIVSVNVGRAREIQWQGQPLRSAIWKAPASGPVRLTDGRVEGDTQANPDVHGGTYKAVYAYDAADLAWWAAELGLGLAQGTPRELAPGTFGENLTLAGLDVSGALIGERWAGGEAELEVTGPRVPCSKLGARMGDTSFPRRFAAAERPGAYLRVVTAGTVAAGDEIRVVHRPAGGPSVAEVSRIYHAERWRAAELLQVPGLDPVWGEWARHRLERAPG
jgi:MOSC domain-containing protein YiiM